MTEQTPTPSTAPITATARPVLGSRSEHSSGAAPAHPLPLVRHHREGADEPTRLCYQDEGVALYQGDCRDVLPISADVVITDPPYAVRWAPLACSECGNTDPTDVYDICSDCMADGATPGHRRTEMLGFVSPNWSEKATHSRGYADHDPEAFAALMGPAWRAIRASLAPGGIAVSFGGNRTLHEMTGAAVAAGFEVLDLLVFLSPLGVAKSTTTLRPGHEAAVLLRAPGPKQHINADWGLSNVFDLRRSNRSESSHLTTKPISWMRSLVQALSKPGDTVLDPFAGSGSTLRAAKDLGRRAVGIEIEPHYCDLAARRLAQGVLDFEESA